MNTKVKTSFTPVEQGLPAELGEYICKFRDGSHPEVFVLECKEELAELHEIGHWRSAPKRHGTGYYWEVSEWMEVPD